MLLDILDHLVVGCFIPVWEDTALHTHYTAREDRTRLQRERSTYRALGCRPTVSVSTFVYFDVVYFE